MLSKVRRRSNHNTTTIYRSLNSLSSHILCLTDAKSENHLCCCSRREASFCLCFERIGHSLCALSRACRASRRWLACHGWWVWLRPSLCRTRSWSVLRLSRQGQGQGLGRQQRRRFGADVTRMVFAGDSAGGNAVVVVNQRRRRATTLLVRLSCKCSSIRGCRWPTSRCPRTASTTHSSPSYPTCTRTSPRGTSDSPIWERTRWLALWATTRTRRSG